MQFQSPASLARLLLWIAAQDITFSGVLRSGVTGERWEVRASDHSMRWFDATGIQVAKFDASLAGTFQMLFGDRSLSMFAGSGGLNAGLSIIPGAVSQIWASRTGGDALIRAEINGGITGVVTLSTHNATAELVIKNGATDITAGLLKIAGVQVITGTEVDARIATHAAIPAAHHARYTDAESDARIALHAADADAHHDIPLWSSADTSAVLIGTSWTEIARIGPIAKAGAGWVKATATGTAYDYGAGAASRIQFRILHTYDVAGSPHTAWYYGSDDSRPQYVVGAGATAGGNRIGYSLASVRYWGGTADLYVCLDAVRHSGATPYAGQDGYLDADLRPVT